MQCVGVESQVPAIVAESPIQPHQSRVGPFIAPCVLPVLQLYFLELAGVEGLAELSHESKVEVIVVLISSLIDKVEIPNDEPLSIVSWCCGNRLVQEVSLFSIGAGAIDRR